MSTSDSPLFGFKPVWLEQREIFARYAANWAALAQRFDSTLTWGVGSNGLHPPYTSEVAPPFNRDYTFFTCDLSLSFRKPLFIPKERFIQLLSPPFRSEEVMVSVLYQLRSSRLCPEVDVSFWQDGDDQDADTAFYEVCGSVALLAADRDIWRPRFWEGDIVISVSAETTAALCRATQRCCLVLDTFWRQSLGDR